MKRGYAWLLVAGVAVVVAYWLQSLVSTDSSSSAVGSADVLDKLAQAIYDFEDPNRNQVATRNNNPGNLKPPNGSSTFWNGQTGVDGRGFAVFGNFVDGWNALLHDLGIKAANHPNGTIQDLFNVWLGGTWDGGAPPLSEGNAITYAQRVASQLGAAVSTTLGQLTGGL